MGLVFFITYFLSLDAMVISFVPGVIALIGSTLGITICTFRASTKQRKNNGK